MYPRRLLVLVEGPLDTRFFNAVIPILPPGIRPQIVEYANTRDDKVNRLLRTERRLGTPILFVADRDKAPCATSRKIKKIESLPELQVRDIVVVSREIESWYLAGITVEAGRRLNIRNIPERTDECAKRDFDRCKPSRYDSEIDFMSEILKRFDVQLARSRNASFDYLMRRLMELIP